MDNTSFVELQTTGILTPFTFSWFFADSTSARSRRPKPLTDWQQAAQLLLSKRWQRKGQHILLLLFTASPGKPLSSTACM